MNLILSLLYPNVQISTMSEGPCMPGAERGRTDIDISIGKFRAGVVLRNKLLYRYLPINCGAMSGLTGTYSFRAWELTTWKKNRKNGDE